MHVLVHDCNIQVFRCDLIAGRKVSLSADKKIRVDDLILSEHRGGRERGMVNMPYSS